MGDAFTSIASLKLPTASRILRSSWCPDKDLLVIVTRPGGRDKLSLWKMQGSKKWEVEFERDSLGTETVIDIAWSPDGMVIAVAHDPPAITLHSIQDGHQQGLLPIQAPSHSPDKFRLTGISWFKAKKNDANASIPDIFKRGNDITGSAHSILKGQPLLDPLHDDSQSLAATEIFAFQSTHVRSAGAPLQPSFISSWPSLPPDHIAASMKPARHGKNQHRPGEELDEVDETNVDSILSVSDNRGCLHHFLDGSYSLGAISTNTICSIISLHRVSQELYFAHIQTDDLGKSTTSLQPVLIQVPLLKQRLVRDVARVSSSAKELTWYGMRLVKEMRASWFGSETQSGAREQGPKWIRTLESRQQEQFGQQEPNAILDLTCLLVTGRASESLSDYLGSGEHMSERGIQKWESSVVDALTKLRDYSEKRLSPACQRIHLLLEEVQGWSLLPQYSLCGIQTSDVNACLELAGRAIILASWLAATARRELVRFKEFIIWLRYETTRATITTDAQNHPPPRHDLLDVNDYLMSGLVVSSIDKWFMGPVPQFSLADLGIPPTRDLASSLQAAREALQDPRNFVWPPNVKHQDLTRLDRNLDALIQDLATRCHKIFSEASRATSRSAVTLPRGLSPSIQELQARRRAGAPLFIRERTVINDNEDDSVLQYLAIQAPHATEGSHLFLVKLHPSGQDSPKPIPAAIAVLECTILGGENAMENTVPIDVLDAEFFDEDTIIVVYRKRNQVGPTFIATVGYSDLAYQDVGPVGDVKCAAREDLVLEFLQGLGNGQLASVPIPINQTRALGGCKEGGVTLAVNGRMGRRVVCVSDDVGLALEILDMEGESEEDEEDMYE